MINEKNDEKQRECSQKSSQKQNTTVGWWNKELAMGFSRKAVIVGIIITLVSGVIFPYYVATETTKKQFELVEKNERENLAIGYLIDIEHVNQSFNDYLAAMNDRADPDYGKVRKWGYQFYPDWGLYYSNRQDISKFDKNLSKELYDFYYVVLRAEESRYNLINYDQLNPINPDYSMESQNQNRAQVKTNLHLYSYNTANYCVYTLIPQLKKDLEKVANEP